MPRIPENSSQYSKYLRLPNEEDLPPIASKQASTEKVRSNWGVIEKIPSQYKKEMTQFFHKVMQR